MSVKELESCRMFKFSVVMAVYNVQDYIVQAVESLVNQTIGFENIQVILVNDGSTDDSLTIANQLADEYPENILVLNQENQGSAVARNNGIKVATGELINFLDPDDFFSDKAFKRVWDAYSAHPDVKVYKAVVHRFEGASGPHFMNYVLHTQRVVYIDNPEEYGAIFQQSAPAFFKYDVFEDDPFPVGFATAEDSYGINKIMMHEKKYVALPNVWYWYRIRKDSQVQTALNKPEKFTPHLKKFILEPIKKFFDDGDGNIHPWLQHVFLYEISWIIKTREVPEPLEERANMDEYMATLYKVVQYIDDQYILESTKWLNFEQRHALVYFKKYGELPNPDKNNYYRFEVGKNDVSVFGNDGKAVTRLSKLRSAVKGLTANDSGIRLNGFVTGLLPWGEVNFYIENDMGDKIKLCPMSTQHFEIRFVGQTIYKPFGYSVNLPVDFVVNSKFIALIAESHGIKKNIALKLGGFTTRLVSENEYSWVKVSSKMARYDLKNKRLVLNEFSIKQLLKWEIKYLKTYIDYQRIRKEKRLGYKMPSVLTIAAVRLLADIAKLTKKKAVNLFMDRIDHADDNAEVLYEYVNKSSNFDNYFILKKDSPDYKRLKKYGYKMVAFRSLKHMFLTFKADNMISSHADAEMTMPFRYRYLRSINDKQNGNFVFLQHGITKGNLSSWLRKSNQDPRMISTTSLKEQESFTAAESGYGFSQDEVKLVGFARYDRLKRNRESEKFIAIMPTWRREIVVEKSADGLRKYTESFKETDYFNNWNDLLKSDALYKIAKSAGLKIKFVPHPNLRVQLEDFDLSRSEVVSETDRYVDIIKESVAVITDFSSVFFDFAYTEKPVIYYQFDEGNFGDRNNKHFDYYLDGLGPVEENTSGVLAALENVAKNNFKMDDVYLDRLAETFEFRDERNSERNWNEIQKFGTNWLDSENGVV